MEFSRDPRRIELHAICVLHSQISIPYPAAKWPRNNIIIVSCGLPKPYSSGYQTKPVHLVAADVGEKLLIFSFCSDPGTRLDRQNLMCSDPRTLKTQVQGALGINKSPERVS